MKGNRYIWVAVLFLAAGLLYWGSPGNGRLPEEELVVWSNPAVSHPGLWPAMLGRFYDSSRDGARAAIRPVAALALKAEFGLFHQDRPGFQRGQIFLLALAASLFYLLCLKIFRSKAGALVGALLFAVHPLGSASVLNVAGLSDLLSLAFSFVSLYLVWASFESGAKDGATDGLVVALIALLFAIWSKESALALVPAFWAWGTARWRSDARASGSGGAPMAETGRAGESPSVYLAAGVGAVCVVVLAQRAIATATLSRSLRLAPAVGLESGLDLSRRLLVGLAGIPTSLRLLLAPISLTYSNDFLLTSGTLAIRAAAGGLVLLALVALLAWAIRRGSDLALWVGLVLFPLVAAMGVVGQGSEVASPRLLYAVVPGMIGLILSGYSALRERFAGARLELVAFLTGMIAICLGGARSIARVRDYQDWETLVRAQTAVEPESSQACFDLGNVYLTRQDWAPAVSEYETAIHLRPDFWMAWVNLGSAYFSQDEMSKSMRAFDLALQGVRGHGEFVTVEARAEYDRALIFMRQDRNRDAIVSLNRTLQIFPDHVFAHANLGAIYANSPSYYRQAMFHLERAQQLETDPDRMAALQEILTKARQMKHDADLKKSGLPADSTLTADPGKETP